MDKYMIIRMLSAVRKVSPFHTVGFSVGIVSWYFYHVWARVEEGDSGSEHNFLTKFAARVMLTDINWEEQTEDGSPRAEWAAIYRWWRASKQDFWQFMYERFSRQKFRGEASDTGSKAHFESSQLPWTRAFSVAYVSRRTNQVKNSIEDKKEDFRWSFACFFGSRIEYGSVPLLWINWFAWTRQMWSYLYFMCIWDLRLMIFCLHVCESPP